MTRLALLGILVLAGPAAAQPGTQDDPPPPPSPPSALEEIDRGFVAGGVLVGGDNFLHGAFTAEGGIRIARAPVWLHVAAMKGNAFDFAGGGDYERFTGGVEERGCSSPGACLVLGFDVGIQRSTWMSVDEDPVEHHHGPIVAGKLGLDAGGDHVRFRAILEIVAERDASNVAPTEWHAGLGLGLGLAYRL
ncbi:MAG: hypothetical protein ABI175_19215 [Polyangiales bacterium]